MPNAVVKGANMNDMQLVTKAMYDTANVIAVLGKFERLSEFEAINKLLLKAYHQMAKQIVELTKEKNSENPDLL